MSHAAVTAVLERSKSKGLARLVFVCIAERMDKYGHTFCSLRDIADRAAIGRKNAPRLIKELLKSGELSVVEKGTRTKSNVYQMAPVLMVRTPRALKVRTPCPQGKGRGVLKVKEGCPQGEGPTILVPSLLPSTPPNPPQGGNGQTHLSESQERLCDLFNRRRTTRWSPKELKSLKTIGDINPDDLTAIERYYKKERRKGEDGRHRRDLLTFLNNFQGEVDRANANAPTHWKGSDNYDFLK